MSNPTCLLYDICDLKVGDMECMDFVKTEEGLESQDEHQKVEKLKESHLLLKKKLSLSHELIKQYNDKIKECQKITTELEAVKDNYRKITLTHNSCLSKITKLEMENEDYRHKTDNFTKIITEQRTKTAADQQHLQQLKCKVEELEHEKITAKKSVKDSFKEKIKTLEMELKAVKESHKFEIKQMEIKLKSNVAEAPRNQSKKKETKISHEMGTCTGNELEPVIIKPETREKCTLTNEFYNIKDDPYPLFCSKCIVKLNPAPVDQILKQMSSCPALITEVPSPSKQIEINRLHRSPQALNQTEFLRPEAAAGNRSSLNESLDSAERNSDVSKSDFQRLEQKICLLERKLHKKIKKEVRGGNPCCGFQYPNNCYLGPYPNLFQPGAMIRSQPDMFQYQNWQESLQSRKRSRRISIQKLNRHGSKLRKKRKLEDGTSEWNIDPIPSKEFICSDRSNDSEHVSEPSNLPLRPESPPLRLCVPKKNASKRRKENESSPPLRQRKRDKLATLFSPVRSLSPSLHDDTEEGRNSRIRIESSEKSHAVNETLSNEERNLNDTRTPEDSPEYETVKCGPRKRGRPRKNAAKTPTKSSLVTKIRNLKKNCNKVKPLVNKTVPANNDAAELTSNQTSEETVPVNEHRSVSQVQPIKHDQILNGTKNYCPVKKHRIAHSTRKQENDSICEANKNSLEIPKTDFQDDSINDVVTNNMQTETAATIEKLDNFEDKIEITGCVKNPDPAAQSKCNNSLRASVDTNCPHLVKNFEDEPIAEIKTGGYETVRIINDVSNTSNSVVDRTSDHKKEVVSLPPGVMIPEMHLGMAGVEVPCEETMPCERSNEMDENESISNFSSNTDKIFSNDASLRILRSKTRIIKSDNTVASKNNSRNAKEDLVDKNSTLINSEAISLTTKMELICCNGNIHPPDSSDNEKLEPVSDIHDTPMSVKSDQSEGANNEILENEILVPVVASRKYKKRTRIAALPVSPMRELRSRRIIIGPSKNLEVKNLMSDENEETNNKTSSKIVQSSENINTQYNGGFAPRAMIEQLLINSRKQSFCNKKKFNEKLQRRKENLVLKELNKLADDVEWKKTELLDMIERLSKFKTHTIAKCTIDFLVTRAEDNEPLDRTHTPPAPLLSKTQQRVLTMLVVLDRTMPNIIKLVQAGIEFRLFRLGHAPEVEIIEELTRVFTAIAKIQKDREKVRILCCDALYCLGLKAMPLIYVILISWPEVFPMSGSSSDPILKCVIDSIMTQTGDLHFPKFLPLKKFLTGYHSYESSGYVSENLAKNLVTALREKRESGLDTALILLAKKKGPLWTYNNIIKAGLLQMIIHRTHPSIYDAFCLLGRLMRSFPLADNNGLVNNILEQLCALIESGEGSMEQQEGIAVALISLFRHKPPVIAKAILNWKPSEPLSESTSRQVTALFYSHAPEWWHKYVYNKCTKLS